MREYDKHDSKEASFRGGSVSGIKMRYGEKSCMIPICGGVPEEEESIVDVIKDYLMGAGFFIEKYDFKPSFFKRPFEVKARLVRSKDNGGK